jgi:hypothetical protein|tara:strand:- start:146 stop:481 length:336 start_codon:yes stop_codon:yes gene_type:complete
MVLREQEQKRHVGRLLSILENHPAIVPTLRDGLRIGSDSARAQLRAQFVISVTALLSSGGQRDSGGASGNAAGKADVHSAHLAKKADTDPRVDCGNAYGSHDGAEGFVCGF